MLVRVNGRVESRQIAEMKRTVLGFVSVPLLKPGEYYERDHAGNVFIYDHSPMGKLCHLLLAHLGLFVALSCTEVLSNGSNVLI